MQVLPTEILGLRGPPGNSRHLLGASEAEWGEVGAAGGEQVRRRLPGGEPLERGTIRRILNNNIGVADPQPQQIVPGKVLIGE